MSPTIIKDEINIATLHSQLEVIQTDGLPCNKQLYLYLHTQLGVFVRNGLANIHRQLLRKCMTEITPWTKMISKQTVK